MNDFTRQSPKRKQMVTRKLLKVYALLDDHGRTKRCAPTEAEIARGEFTSSSNGKAIFPTETNARAFAVAIVHDTGGKPQRIYRCPRGEHWHTTSKEARGVSEC